MQPQRAKRWVVALALLGAQAVVASCSSAPTSTAANVEDATETPATAVAVETSQVDPPAPTPASVETDEGTLKLLAHRGLHQTYDREGLERDTCTADRIYPVEHDYIENTLPSIQAAFALGADVVEIDIAATTDGVLAVFHDWTVDCRTEASGEVRSFTWDELSKLDIGYGYTTDGQTFPLRGKGVGLMPRLEEVLAAFPDEQFLINFKSGNPAEAELLHEVIEEADAAGQVWAVYGGEGAVERYLSLAGSRGFTESSVLACLTTYMTSTVDARPLCSNTVVAVPSDLAGLLPGWPQPFFEDMGELGSHVIIIGPGQNGIDTRESFSSLPQDVEAYVWTNRMDVVSAEAQSE